MVDGNKNQWNGMVGELMKKAVDLCSLDLTFTPERSKVIKFGTALSMSKMSIVTKSLPANQNMDLTAFINIFHINTWVAYFTSVIVLAISMTAVNGIFCGSFNILDNLGTLYTYFLMRGDISKTNGAPGELTLRILTITALLMLFVMFNFYTAFLTSLMSASGDQGGFRTVKELIDQEYNIVTVKSSFLHTVLEESAKKNPHMAFLVENMDPDKDYLESFDTIPKRLQKDKSAIVVNQEFANGMGRAIQFHSDLSHLFQWEVTGFGYPTDSEFAGCFNYHINKMKESGFLMHIIRKWVDSGDEKPPKGVEQGQENFFAINFNNVAFVVLIMVFGCGTSVTICALEFIHACFMGRLR